MAALRLQLSEKLTNGLSRGEAAEESKNHVPRKRQTEKRKSRSTDPPEVSKVLTLDRELADVVKDKSEPVESRVREYEELLASYKEAVEKLKKYDGGSVRFARSSGDDSDDDGDAGGDDSFTTGQLEDLLKKAGVKFEKDRVFIPLKKDEKMKQKRSFVSYSRDTFDNVVKFVNFGSKVYTNHLVRHVTRKLLELVKNLVDVSKYPGFADVARANLASFNGVWTRL
jgi:hypothetical protein